MNRVQLAIIAFVAMNEAASAHDRTCEGNPVPRWVKTYCCGAADAHRLDPEQISRGPNAEYVIAWKDYRFVISADKALPSDDPCSYLFFSDQWAKIEQPQVRCFLTPMGE